jgi:c-di-GMP-binding flagellar brake protein YcgR
MPTTCEGFAQLGAVPDRYPNASVSYGHHHQVPSERRTDARVNVLAVAWVRVRHNEPVKVSLYNVSTSGACLVGPITLAVGERIDVLIEVDSPIDLRSEVVRAESIDMTTDRVAVRFLDVGDESVQQLRAFISKHS